MSLSRPMTSSPFSSTNRAVSLPTSPDDPVTTATGIPSILHRIHSDDSLRPFDPTLPESQFLNRLCQILFEALEFHVDPIHNEIQKHERHPEESPQAGTFGSRQTKQNIDK